MSVGGLLLYSIECPLKAFQGPQRIPSNVCSKLILSNRPTLTILILETIIEVIIIFISGSKPRHPNTTQSVPCSLIQYLYLRLFLKVVFHRTFFKNHTIFKVFLFPSFSYIFSLYSFSLLSRTILFRCIRLFNISILLYNYNILCLFVSEFFVLCLFTVHTTPTLHIFLIIIKTHYKKQLFKKL